MNLWPVDHFFPVYSTGQRFIKAELLQEGVFFLFHLFARDVLLMKKLEIEKLSPLLLQQF